MTRTKRVAVLAAGAIAVMVGQATAQDRLVQEERDRATGAVVRVYRIPGGARIDVDAPAIRLRKQLIDNKVVTSLTGSGESLVIEFDGRTFSASGTRGRASATRGDEVALRRVRELVAGSPLTGRTAALVGRMAFGANSALEPVLLTTRAFLLSLSGDPSGLRDVSQWMRRERLRTHVIRASIGQKTPSECWAEYSKEAIAAWTEYEECMNSVKWWDPFGEAACTLIYDLRALGAFAWWMDCVKLLGIITG
jgi:hypothetical protein